MSKTSAETTQKAHDRRSFVRVEDTVALAVREVAGDGASVAARGIARRRLALPNVLAVENEARLPALRKVSARYPEVGAYLKHLNAQIETLVRVLSEDPEGWPDSPTDRVSLNARGIRFVSPLAYAAGATLELRLLLFPECTRMLVCARVVRCEPLAAEEAFDVSAEFSEVLEEDRELLIKHIHAIQMRALTDA